MSMEKSGTQYPGILQTPGSCKHPETVLKLPLQSLGPVDFKQVEVWVKTWGCLYLLCGNCTDYKLVKDPFCF